MDDGEMRGIANGVLNGTASSSASGTVSGVTFGVMVASHFPFQPEGCDLAQIPESQLSGFVIMHVFPFAW